MSSMADLAGALGGAGAAGPPPDQGADTGGGQQFDNSLVALDASDEALHAFIQLDPDDADRAEATKALQIVVRLKAANQQSAQSGDLKSLQRALASGGPPGGGPGG